MATAIRMWGVRLGKFTHGVSNKQVCLPPRRANPMRSDGPRAKLESWAGRLPAGTQEHPSGMMRQEYHTTRWEDLPVAR